MKSISLRTLVSAIGIFVAAIIFVAVPSGYFIVGYMNATHDLQFKAHLTAGRLAKYIYVQKTLWQYQAGRLAELIEISEAEGEEFSQQILDNENNVVAAAGPEQEPPSLAQSYPISVHGAVVGRVEAKISLLPLLRETSLVVVLSALLGFGAYFAVRMFPLRVLDRTLGALEDAQRSLSVKNERFDAALTNMSQGLCMFGADEKLVVFNRRFAEIYGIAPERIKAGMTTPELMALAQSCGNVTDKDPEGTLALQRSFIREHKAGKAIERLTDGRTIAISHQPMADDGFVATFEDVTERLLSEEKITHMARYDALTNLPNRAFFYEQMEGALNHLRRSESLAVMSLDLDHFKNVNDTLGHPIGDLLLQGAADRMRSCVRDDDIVARLGGDEFAIVQIPSGQPADVIALATRLIESVGAPYQLDGHQVIVGASVGIAAAPGDGSEPDCLMKNADLALYRAKADGGGAYRFFELEMDARMQARRALELDLRKAIVNGEFELYFQPIVTVLTGKITACEALIRWHHPERGMLAPMEFIPLAEETGLIVPVGEWVLRQACAEAVRWPHDIMITVNLSPAQFKNRNLAQTVISALAASGLPASRLELEITELVLLQESNASLAILHQLRNLGVKIAMDDFGTGYSSLGYLRSFPFDKIKIDQSFVRDLATSEDSLAIIRAVVGLSSSLGITTTAEGVETKEQLASLTSEGCNEVQGFLFSPPRPAAEIERILAEVGPRIEAVA